MARTRKTADPVFDEFGIIERYFAPLTAAAPGAFALTDDAAVMAVEEGHRLVVTSDALVSGVHFTPQAPPDTVAAKALRVNLSDLAAMGARPLGYTLAAALPRDVTPSWLEAFSRSLAADQKSFGIVLIGGDTVVTPGPMTLTICALGLVPEGRELRRSGARPGDRVYVSGTIGDAALGLMAVKGQLPGLGESLDAELRDRYHRPRPRIALGLKLLGIANAAIDISDGLVADLGHVCAASGVAATIDATRIPLSTAAQTVTAADDTFLSAILSGGDDYELLFSAPPTAAAVIDKISADLKLSLTPIGEIGEGEGVRVIDAGGQPISLDHHGYRHFLP